jgi:hypothetical protein
MCCHYFDQFGYRLELANVPISTTKYFAISHVCGEAEWMHVPGVGSVLMLRKKSRFIRNELRNIAEGNYFSMDILCINQRNKNARIAVTRHIPAIYRNAE